VSSTRTDTAAASRPALAGHLAWSTADQALNTIGNFFLTVTVARSSSPEAFGGFALAYAIYSFALAACQSLISETLLVTAAELDDDDFRQACAGAAGAAGALGIALGLPLAVVGLLWPPGGTHALVIFGVALPLLFVQDTMRLAMIGRRRGRPAATNDLLWLVLQVVLLVVASWTVSLGPSTVLLCWCLPILVAAPFALLQWKVLPRPFAGIRWITANRNLSGSYLLESMALAGATQAVLVGVAIFSGLGGTGGFRAAQSLYGPLNVVFLVLRTMGLGEVRRARSAESALARTLVVSIAASSVGVVAMVAVLVVPGAVGRGLFGDTWREAATLLLPLGIQKVAIGFSAGSFVALRTARSIRASMTSRITFAAVQIAGGFTGAALGGARGAAWGLAISTALESAALWRVGRTVLLARFPHLPDRPGQDVSAVRS
jgi:O-antigen/teichoic acid export membrane protein